MNKDMCKICGVKDSYWLCEGCGRCICKDCAIVCDTCSDFRCVECVKASIENFNTKNYKDICGYKITGENQITISEKQYKQLLKDSEKLAALEYFDIKNWKCYKEAMDMLNDWNSKEIEEDG